MSVSDLLQTVLEDPSSDTARLVYADACSASGDPRGEFITLQCHVDRTERQTQRARALRRRWGSEWSAGLWPLIPSEEVRFERGFLVSCALRRAPAWEQQLDLMPEVALVSRVRLVEPQKPEQQALVHVLPHLTGLRILHGALPEEVRALRSPLIELRLQPHREVASETLDRLLVPTLQILEVRGASIASVRGAVRRMPLKEIHVGAGSLVRWWRALAERPLTIGIRDRGWMLRLSPDTRLDVWSVPDDRSRMSTLIDQIRAFDIGALSFIHVKNGRLPSREELLALRGAAQGAPLLLPARWRQLLATG